jgi:CRP-like cAMP-binding protein
MSDFFSYTGVAEPAGGGSPRAILADLSGADWEKFIAHAARRRYPAGALVLAAGSTDRALYFVASGQVELAQRGAPARHRPALRGEGGVFGILSFLDSAPSDVSATVTADAPAELLMLTPDTLQQLAAWQPRIAMTLLRDLGAHVAARLRGLQPGD